MYIVPAFVPFTVNGVTPAVNVDEPVTLTEPVNWWVLVLNDDPNRVEPVTKSTELVIVCTTNVCAVKVPATVNVFANDAVSAETAFDADCAKATNDSVEANDADATEPDSVMLPEVNILPVTVSEPDIVGELSIILFIF